MADNIMAARRSSIQLTLTGERLRPGDVSRQARLRKLVETYRTERWTRVQGRAQILAADTASYLVGKDLDTFAKRQQAAEEPGTGQIVFNPDSYLAVQDQLRVEDYALADDEKVEYARIATRVRRQLRARAESLAHDALGADGDLAEAEVQMEVDLSRRYDKEKRSPERSLRHLSRPSFLVPARGKTLARHQLSAADI